MAKDDKKKSKAQEFDDNFDSSFDSLDQFDQDFGDFENIDGGNSKPPKKRKPFTDFATSAVKSAALPSEQTFSSIKSSIDRSMPNTGQLLGDATDSVRQVRGMTQDFISQVAPTVNRVRRVSARLLDRMDSDQNSWIANKIRKLLRVAEEGPTRTLEDERNELIASKLESLMTIQLDLSKNQEITEEARTIVQQQREDIRHEDQQTILARIAQSTEGSFWFAQTSARSYFTKSLELKYKSMFYLQDLVAMTKSSVAILDNKLEKIAYNSGLPDLVKSSMSERFKLLTEQKIMGKIQGSMANWSSTVIQRTLDNLKKNVFDTMKDIVIDIGGGLADMGEMSMEMEDMNKEFGGEQKSKASSAGGFFGKILQSALIKKGFKKLYDSNMTEFDSFDSYVGSKRDSLLMKLNSSLRDSESGFLRFIGDSIFPTVNKDRRMSMPDMLRDALSPAVFDIATRQSIVDVIPGLLSKINSHVEGISSKMGAQAADELTYDLKTRDFKRASDVAEEYKTKLFQRQEYREEAVRKIVQHVVRRYMDNGGDQSIISAHIRDLTKVVINSARTMTPIDPKLFQKLADDNLTAAQEGNLDTLFKGVPNKETVIDIFVTAYMRGDKLDEEGISKLHSLSLIYGEQTDKDLESALQDAQKQNHLRYLKSQSIFGKTTKEEVEKYRQQLTEKRMKKSKRKYLTPGEKKEIERQIKERYDSEVLNEDTIRDRLLDVNFDELLKSDKSDEYFDRIRSNRFESVIDREPKGEPENIIDKVYEDTKKAVKKTKDFVKNATTDADGEIDTSTMSGKAKALGKNIKKEVDDLEAKLKEKDKQLKEKHNTTSTAEALKQEAKETYTKTKDGIDKTIENEKKKRNQSTLGGVGYSYYREYKDKLLKGNDQLVDAEGKPISNFTIKKVSNVLDNAMSILKAESNKVISSKAVQNQLKSIDDQLKGKDKLGYSGMIVRDLTSVKSKLEQKLIDVRNKEISQKLIKSVKGYSDKIGNGTMKFINEKDLLNKSPQQMALMLKNSIDSESSEFKAKFLKDNNASSVEEALFNYFENHWKDIKLESESENPTNIFAKVVKATDKAADKTYNAIQDFKKKEDADKLTTAVSKNAKRNYKRTSEYAKARAEKVSNYIRSKTIAGVNMGEFMEATNDQRMSMFNQAMKTNQKEFVNWVESRYNDIMASKINGRELSETPDDQLTLYQKRQLQEAAIFKQILEIVDKRKKDGEQPVDTINKPAKYKTREELGIPRNKKEPLHDKVNVSGPGTYHQMTDQELHLPLNDTKETQGFFKRMADAIKSVIPQSTDEVTPDSKKRGRGMSRTSTDLLREAIENQTTLVSSINDQLLNGLPLVNVTLGQILNSIEKNGMLAILSPDERARLAKAGRPGFISRGVSGIGKLIGTVYKGSSSIVGGALRGGGSLFGGMFKGLGSFLGGFTSGMGRILPALITGGAYLYGGLARGAGSAIGGIARGLGSAAQGVGSAIRGMGPIAGRMLDGMGWAGRGILGVAKFIFKGVFGATKFVAKRLLGIKGAEQMAASAAITEQIIINHVGNKLDKIIDILGGSKSSGSFLGRLFGGGENANLREGGFQDYSRDKKVARKERQMESITANVQIIAEAIAGKSVGSGSKKGIIASLKDALGFNKDKNKSGDKEGEEESGGSGGFVDKAIDLLTLRQLTKGNGTRVKKPGRFSRMKDKLGGMFGKGGKFGLLGKIGKFAFKGAAGLGLVASGVSMASNLKEGNWGSAAIDAGLGALSLGSLVGFGSMASGTAAAGAALAGLVSNPIGWAVLAGALVAGTGYGLYRFFGKKNERKKAREAAYSKLIKAYGVDPDQIEQLVDLEELVYDKLQKESLSRSDVQLQAKKFGFDPESEREVKYFVTWLQERFIPLFMTKQEFIEKQLKKDLYDMTELNETEQSYVAQALTYQMDKLSPNALKFSPNLKAYQQTLPPEEKAKLNKRIDDQKRKKDDAKKHENDSWLQKVVRSPIVAGKAVGDWFSDIKTRAFGTFTNKVNLPSKAIPLAGASMAASVVAESAKQFGGTAKARSRKTIEMIVNRWGPLVDEVLPIVYSMTGVILPKELALAMIAQESSGNPNAKSHANAQGLVQIMPDTAKWLSSKVGIPTQQILTDPRSNLIAGYWYIIYLYKQTKSWEKALLAYNWGIGNVQKFDRGTRTDKPLEAQMYAAGTFANYNEVVNVIGKKPSAQVNPTSKAVGAAAAVTTAVAAGANAVIGSDKKSTSTKAKPAPTSAAGTGAAIVTGAAVTAAPVSYTTPQQVEYNMTQAQPRDTYDSSKTNQILDQALQVQIRQLETLDKILKAVKGTNKSDKNHTSDMPIINPKDLNTLIKKIDLMVNTIASSQNVVQQASTTSPSSQRVTHQPDTLTNGIVMKKRPIVA